MKLNQLALSLFLLTSSSPVYSFSTYGSSSSSSRKASFLQSTTTTPTYTFAKSEEIFAEAQTVCMYMQC